MKTILVIENSSKIVSRLLSDKMENTNIEHHRDIDIALKRIIKNHFDLIIIDANVKSKDTIDISKLLRTAAISGKPVIVVSSCNIFNFAKAGLSYFNNKINENIKYMFNPFNETLKQTVGEMINIKPINHTVIFNRLLNPLNGNNI